MKVFVSTSVSEVSLMKKIVKGAKFSIAANVVTGVKAGTKTKTLSPVTIPCRITDVQLDASGNPKKITYSSVSLRDDLKVTVTLAQFLKKLQAPKPTTAKGEAFRFTATRVAAEPVQQRPAPVSKTVSDDPNVGKKVSLLLKGQVIDSGTVVRVKSAGVPMGRGNVQESKVFALKLRSLGTLNVPVKSSVPSPFPSKSGVLQINITSFDVSYKTAKGGK